MEEKPEYDWLVCRLWGKIAEKTEICLLTTRGYILARHIREHIRANIRAKGNTFYKATAGLRRYRTKSGADKKVNQLNRKFKTNGYSSVREDEI